MAAAPCASPAATLTLPRPAPARIPGPGSGTIRVRRGGTDVEAGGPGPSVARRRRGRRTRRVLRGPGAVRDARPAGRDRHVRSPAHAVRPRAPRRGAGPPEDQEGHGGLRQDRRRRALPVLRRDRVRARPDALRPAAPLPPGRVLHRRADRPAARHPRRGSRRQPPGDRVRRLVQRPPGLPGPRVRPRLLRSGRHRRRQRRGRRGADSLPDPRRARADRHRRRRPGGPRRVVRARRPPARPPRPRAGGLHEPGDPGARRDARRLHPRAAAGAGARPGEPRAGRGRPRDGAQARDPARLRRTRGARQAAQPDRAVLRLPVELLDDGSGRVGAVRVVHNRLEEAPGGRIRPVPTDQFEEIPAGLVFRSVGYRGVALEGLPFDEASGTIPNSGAASAPRPTGRRCRGSTSRAGSSAARPA